MTASSPPLLSFIIAARNAADKLPECLESLAAQRFRSFSVTVQDACSNDGTEELLAGYAERLPELIVRREPDTGVCDAWNKALPSTTGEWICFLGADDFLLDPGALGRITPFLRAQPEAIEYVAASAAVVNENSGICDTLVPNRDPFKALRAGMCFPHQGLFHRRRLFAHAVFDTSLRITGDYDFLNKTLRPENYAFFPTPITAMRLGGMSTRPAAAIRQQIECAKTARRCRGGVPSPLLLLRLGRALVFLCLHTIAGHKTMTHFADALRIHKNATPMWSEKTRTRYTREMPPENPRFSLLIATLNRTTPLLRLLESLRTQRYKNFEVLIADQNPPEMLKTLLAPFENALSLRRISVPNEGVSNARNALLPLASGDIIAFPDDDCFYAPDALERVRLRLRDLPHLQGIVAGWSKEEEKLPDYEAKALPLLNKYSAFKRGETYTQFYRKKAVRDLFFDPELGPGTNLPYGCGEDSDYLLRTLERGHAVGRLTETLIHHAEPNPTDPALPRKAYAYGIGRMRLLRKHGFPLWFKLINVVYPAARLFLEGRKALPYRKAMFLGRLRGLTAKP